MGRKRLDDGKRITICVKVSEAEAVAIDVARGSATRSAWGRGQLLAGLKSQRPQPEKRGGQIAPPNAPVLSTTTQIPAPPPARVTAKCDHPKGRRLKGLCNACGTYVG